jgi:type IX secretion system PorP/SprF family membrane protein
MPQALIFAHCQKPFEYSNPDNTAMQKILTLFVLTLLSFQAIGQDNYFSQSYASPLLLNPSLTGAFEGRYRVSSIYRDQWSGALTNPYKTFSTAFDIKWGLGHSTARYKDQAAVGLLFYNDKAGALDFSTSQISVSAAYHKALDIRNTQYLSAGLQVGIAQKNVNFGNMNFEDQFNGATGYTEPTAENLPENNFAYFDYSVGLNYSLSPEYTRAKLFVGAAMHHFLSPSVSFFARSDDTGLQPENTLKKRYSLQISGFVPIADRAALLPRGSIDQQGDHRKIDAGTNLRINTSSYKNVAVHVGGYARSVTDFDNAQRLDAVVAMFGVEFNNVLIGVSYDINFDKIARSDRRSFELSVAYLGEYEDDIVLCPKF